jgi:hypothetical protein
MQGDRISMSQRERDVLKVMSLVLSGKRTQIEAAWLLCRIWPGGSCNEDKVKITVCDAEITVQIEDPNVNYVRSGLPQEIFEKERARIKQWWQEQQQDAAGKQGN